MQVRAHFAASLEGGQEAIEGVRLVRDPDSQMGKGFGFLLLRVSSKRPRHSYLMFY